MSAEPLRVWTAARCRERALEALRSAITSGRYRPGDHLGEVELATHLGVSRGTVREALRHLQQEGLVTAGNRGMLRVNEISPREVRELFRVRAALESLAVTEIIRSADRARAVAALREALSRLRAPRVTSRPSWRPTWASTCSCAGCRATRCWWRRGATLRAASG